MCFEMVFFRLGFLWLKIQTLLVVLPRNNKQMDQKMWNHTEERDGEAHHMDGKLKYCK